MFPRVHAEIHTHMRALAVLDKLSSFVGETLALCLKELPAPLDIASIIRILRFLADSAPNDVSGVIFDTCISCPVD